MSSFVRGSVRSQEEKIEYLNSLTEITFNEVKLDSFSLKECINLEKIILGKNVSQINNDAFFCCHKLKCVELDPENKYFVLREDCLIEKESNRLLLCLGIPRVPSFITKLDFRCYVSTETVQVFMIPSHLQEVICTNRCFSIKSIQLDPNNNCFELEGNCLFIKGQNDLILGCEESVIPNRTKTINTYAFTNSHINKIVIPSSVEAIRSSAFHTSGLEEIVFEKGLKSIGNYAFSECAKLKSVNFPKSLEEVGEAAFWKTKSLTQIKSFGGVKTLKRAAFYGSGIKELVLPETIISMEYDAFSMCDKLEKVILYCQITSLPNRAFSNCPKLKTVEMNDHIKQISDWCFYKCKSLVEIRLSKNLERLETMAFYFCSKLEKVNWDELKSLKRYNKDVFTGCRKLVQPEKPKRAVTLPELFFSFEKFGDIIKNSSVGSTLTLMSDTASDLFVKYQSGCEYEGKDYLLVTKSDNYFIIEVERELKMYWDAYEVYYCHLVPDSDKRFSILQEKFGK